MNPGVPLAPKPPPGETTRHVARLVLAFALAVTSLTIAFIAYQQTRLTTILSTSDWCARAIQAEAITNRAQTSCGTLLLKQISAIAINSHIYAGSMALSLLVLIVIVVAGGQLSVSASRAGVGVGIGKEAPIVQAAQDTADAAQDKADEIKADAPKGGGKGEAD